MDVVRKHFESLDSTNNWAKRNAAELPAHAVILISADEQTAGRGRFKRLWVSPRGENIYATFCFHIEKHRSDVGNLPQVMALAACQALEDQGLSPQLKWPNDIMLSGKKVGGILCETTPLSDTLLVILGIGLNVNLSAEAVAHIDRPATSLWIETGRQGNVEETLRLLQKKFLAALEIFLEEGFYQFLKPYKTRLMHHVGDLIRFHDNRVVWEGAFVAMTSNGALELKLASGEIKRFIAGEIV